MGPTSVQAVGDDSKSVLVLLRQKSTGIWPTKTVLSACWTGSFPSAYNTNFREYPKVRGRPTTIAFSRC